MIIWTWKDFQVFLCYWSGENVGLDLTLGEMGVGRRVAGRIPTPCLLGER